MGAMGSQRLAFTSHLYPSLASCITSPCLSFHTSNRNDILKLLVRGGQVRSKALGGSSDPEGSFMVCSVPRGFWASAWEEPRFVVRLVLSLLSVSPSQTGLPSHLLPIVPYPVTPHPRPGVSLHPHSTSVRDARVTCQSYSRH